MKIRLPYNLGLAVASLVLAFGLTKLGAQLFLLEWAISSTGHPDIAARGPWLLGLFLLPLALLTSAATAVVLTVLIYRTKYRVRATLPYTLPGSLAGAALIVVGADPTVLLLSGIRWSSDIPYHTASLAVGAVIVVIGFQVARQTIHVRPDHVPTAA